ncbi:MAG TPA: hypothetical protein VI160_04030 [Gemmatimonadales bacterium]
MTVNRQYCPIINTGEVCTDPSGNGVIEGSFWPRGTPDSYIFNSGLQIAGSIPSSAGFAWAGDTVGAFFMDPRGDQADGAPVTNVFNSLDLDDQANWPTPDGTVADTSVYAPVLIGRNAVSQQDVWFRAWDGNPNKEGGRAHPMGVLVETRGMAWNYPTGNEDILYFVYTFTNVTSANEADYNNNTNPNNTPAYRANLAALGAQFQQLNNAQFGITIPTGGYELDSVYSAFFMDCDVGTNAGDNYSTVVVPFNMSGCYESSFNDPVWAAAGSFTPDIFGAPFAAAPGMVGVKYLKSPTDSLGNQLGLRMFGNTLNSGTGYPDAVGIKQMLRYISGFSSPAAGDNPCTNQGQQLALKYCYLAQVKADTRFFQSSGPFKLKAGQSKTIVVAYANAAPVNTPYLQTQLGGDFKPGLPANGDSIFNNPSLVRQIERVFGWVTQADGNADNSIEQNEVTTVPRSLLNKGLVAQAVFDGKFLLPFAPDPPQFFLIPGDNQVTVVWQKSKSETTGDPFYALASNPASALYDPNFRQLDVEGYRIYRGRTSGALQLVAQFDYAGTQMIDYTGAFGYQDCAPELGRETGCPIQFDSVPTPASPGNPVPLVGNVVQVPPGGHTLLQGQLDTTLTRPDTVICNSACPGGHPAPDTVRTLDTVSVFKQGAALITKADTAVTGGNSGFPALSDGGVPFAYVDRSVRNLFQYYYSVTAFDVNSVKSGPTSLESPKSTKSVTPRAPTSTVKAAVTVQSVAGADGTPLTATAYPTINAATGTFNGNMPPANDISLSLANAVVEALPQGVPIKLRIDSVQPGFTSEIGTVPTSFMTIIASGDTVHQAVPLNAPPRTATGAGSFAFGATVVPYDSGNARRFGMHFTQDVRMPLGVSGQVEAEATASPYIAVAARRYGVFGGSKADAYLAHSRWFAEAAGAEPPQPTIVGIPDSAHNSGALPGIASIWMPQAYRDAGGPGALPGAIDAGNFRGYGFAQVTWYPGDFIVTWNADSSLTVFDSTHHVPLPYTADNGSGYGFLNLADIQAAGLTAGDLADNSPGASVTMLEYHAFYATNPTCTPSWWFITCVNLAPKAKPSPIDINHDGVSDGTGIALFINGEGFLMVLSGGNLPAAGTKWHLRAVPGEIAATCAPALQAVMTSCSGYTFSGPAVRSSYAPGLTYTLLVTAGFSADSSKSGDLSLVHTVPDPYYVTNALEVTPNNKVLKFVNLPARAIIRIYSVSGVLVQVLTHNDVTGGGEQAWDLRNRSNQFIASGVYFYHVEGPDGKTKIGRFTVVQFAP